MPRPPPKSMWCRGMPARLHRFDQVEHAVHRIQVRRLVGDLRADVAVDAHHLQPGQAGGAPIGGQGLRRGRCRTCCPSGRWRYRDGSSGSTSGLTRMLTGADLPAARGDFAQHFEFGFALHVEAADADLQRAAHFGAGLADAGKDDVARLRRPRPARARVRRPTRCRIRSRPARRPAARPGEDWPSSHSRCGPCGRRSRAGKRPALPASPPWSRRTAACRARAPSASSRTSSANSSPSRQAKCGWPGKPGSVAFMGRRHGLAVPVRSGGAEAAGARAQGTAARWRAMRPLRQSAGKAGPSGHSRPAAPTTPAARTSRRALAP